MGSSGEPMREIVSSLMAVLLFIQAASGWCWQPRRDCWQCSIPVAKVSQPCCGHDCEGGQGKQPQAPCDHKLECHGICTYVLPERTQIDSSDSVASLDFVAVHATAAIALTTDVVRWELGQCSLDSKPPLRLHLYHQVLLI